MAFTECHLLDTGYCLGSEAALIEGGRWNMIRCHCLVGLLHHPEFGWGLWDTGMSRDLWIETQWFPYRLYRWATPLPRQRNLCVVSELPRFGLTVYDIEWIVLSHLHGDHVAGLRDFPDADIYVTRSAYEYATGLRGFGAVCKGYIPALFPDDFKDRVHLLDNFESSELGSLGPAHELFEDRSALLFPLPGHARGQIGMLAETDNLGKLLFVADSCLHRASIRENKPPGSITKIIADEPQEIIRTIARLHEFCGSHPEISVIPTHCPEVFQEFIVRESLR